MTYVLLLCALGVLSMSSNMSGTKLPSSFACKTFTTMGRISFQRSYLSIGRSQELGN